MNENKAEKRILVTGVGAIIGYGIIKSIRKSGIKAHIIGMDIYPDAVGQFWCDEFIQAKYAVDPNYVDFLRGIIAEKKIDIVFFGTEQEIYRIDRDREAMGNDLKKVVLNNHEMLDLSQDKWLTHEALKKRGLGELAIPSVIEGDYRAISEQFGPEFLLKPRSSYASKGIQKVGSETDFAFYKDKMGKNFMAQKLIGDVEHEYTVGVFGLGDGTYSGMIQMRRKLSQEGATAKAESIWDNKLADIVIRLCSTFCPIGPTNLQFRLSNNQYYLLEFNPRISSSTSLRMAFGYNEAVMSINYFLYGQITQPQVKQGRAVRYIDEVVTLT